MVKTDNKCLNFRKSVYGNDKKCEDFTPTTYNTRLTLFCDFKINKF